jgi:hypothetical protein
VAVYVLNSSDGEVAYAAGFALVLSAPMHVLFTFVLHITRLSRSQWPRGLRHELSSLAQPLGSWIRIPLEVWISVCIHSVFVMFCV